MSVTGVDDHTVQTARSFDGRSNYVVFLSCRVDRLSIKVILWRPYDLFPSIFPVVLNDLIIRYTNYVGLVLI